MMVWSGPIDERTCEPCEAMMGTVNATPPHPDCESDLPCRCVLSPAELMAVDMPHPAKREHLDPDQRHPSGEGLRRARRKTHRPPAPLAL